jgi:hypothetical protein
MAIAKNPMRNTSEAEEQKAAAFIAKTEKSDLDPVPEGNRKPTMIRV